MSKLHIDKCPICGQNQFEKIMTCTDHYATGEPYDLYRCTDSNLMFTQNAPVESEMGRYYETQDYISHTDTRKGLMNYIYHKVRKRMLTEKARLLSRNSHLTRGKLLDIEVGMGYSANKMKSEGMDCIVQS